MGKMTNKEGTRGEGKESKRYLGDKVIHLLHSLGSNKYFWSTDSVSGTVSVSGIMVRERERTCPQDIQTISV